MAHVRIATGSARRPVRPAGAGRLRQRPELQHRHDLAQRHRPRHRCAGRPRVPLAGRAIAGKHDNTLAILGGALLGGVAGNVLRRSAQLRSAAPGRDRRRRPTPSASGKLDYERPKPAAAGAGAEARSRNRTSTSSGSSERGAGPAPGAVTTTDRRDAGAAAADRPGLLSWARSTGFTAPAPARRSCSSKSSQGLPRTGSLTPSLVQSMKVASVRLPARAR